VSVQKKSKSQEVLIFGLVIFPLLYFSFNAYVKQKQCKINRACISEYIRRLCIFPEELSRLPNNPSYEELRVCMKSINNFPVRSCPSNGLISVDLHYALFTCSIHGQSPEHDFLFQESLKGEYYNKIWNFFLPKNFRK
jgi:hypothetical protein